MSKRTLKNQAVLFALVAFTCSVVDVQAYDNDTTEKSTPRKSWWERHFGRQKENKQNDRQERKERRNTREEEHAGPVETFVASPFTVLTGATSVATDGHTKVYHAHDRSWESLGEHHQCNHHCHHYHEDAE